MGRILGRLSEQPVDYSQMIAEKRLLPPLDHPDPAHCFVSGTGLTHLGSATARREMPLNEVAETENKECKVPLTDSMRMFQIGLEGGKPTDRQISAQLEWFYKCNGHCVVAAYGLTASVVTNDLKRAFAFANNVEAGVVKINAPTTGLALQASFGGFKDSSANTFKEQGAAAAEFYTRTKTVYLNHS